MWYDEHGLGTLDDRHHQSLFIEHEAVAASEDGAARQRRAELDAAVGAPPAVHVRPILPSERDRVVGKFVGRWRKLRLPDDAVDNGHVCAASYTTLPRAHGLLMSRG